MVGLKVAAVDATEGALIETGSALRVTVGTDSLLSIHAKIGRTSTESAEDDEEHRDEHRDEQLTFLNKSVKSGHAISPEAIIFLSVLRRLRALRCK